MAELVVASSEDIDAAYASAKRAQPAWAATLPGERSALLYRLVTVLDARRDEIVGWLIHETGSTRTKANIEWGAVRDGMLEAAMLPSRAVGRILPVDVPNKESRTYRQPIGVVGIISPWNFPLHLSNRSVAPALALGNAVVVKPSEESPVTGGPLLASLYAEAGLPPGLFKVLVGRPDEIGDASVSHSVPRFISFTGSTQVGRRVGRLAAGGGTLKHVALELGGNAPLVVLDDADLERAVQAAIVARFMHQGQICMSANRIIVQDGVYDAFVDAFVGRAAGLKVGDPDESDTVIALLINLRQLDRACGHIKHARAEGTSE